MSIAQTSKPKRFWRFLFTGAIPIILLLIGVAAASFVIGFLLAPNDQAASTNSDVKYWTCSMHPQFELEKPGDCPICGMDLIPLTKKTGGHPREYEMTPEAAALADIQTSLVERKHVAHTINLVGKIDYDETRLNYITAWVDGRLDRLYVDYTGVRVRKGDHLVTMYSPNLLVDQQSLLLAWGNYQKFKDQPNSGRWLRNLKNAEQRLRLLGLLEGQIENIKLKGETSDQMTIYSTIGGIVIHKNATEGMYVKTGAKIYTVADLSQVWVYMDAYESDFAWLRQGQEVEFTTESYPGDIFKGRIAFIDRVLNEKTRTVKVRVNVPNKDMRLKPGMFVRARVHSRLAIGGQVIDPSLAGKWISPMHPEIIKDAPGKCDICGMDLVPAEELGFVAADSGAEPPLVVPAKAPLITGRRAIVYVKVPKTKTPTFQGREILLGRRVGDYYIVRHGLEEGEEVVTRGNFKIDSALQLQASPSMMNPKGGSSSTGHEHHGQPTAGQDKHKGHTPAEHQAMANQKPASAKDDYQPPAFFRVALKPVYHSYFEISEALARDDLAAAREHLKKLLVEIKRIDFELLGDEGRGQWKTASDRIIFAAYGTLDAANRESTREQFVNLSHSFMPLMHTFGHAMDGPVYQFHCTMAFDNKGAAWLQTFDKAHNPYFGPKMPDCGERQAAFDPIKPLTVPADFRRQLSGLYGAYLKMHSAMSKKNQLQDAVLAAGELQTKLNAIDSSMLDQRSRSVWLLAKQKIHAAAKDDWRGVKVKEAQKRFEAIAGVMLGIADQFGHNFENPLYKAFCPMAFGEKGAFWLQAEKKVVNPFFNGGMQGCGDIKRTFQTSNLLTELEIIRKEQP